MQVPLEHRTFLGEIERLPRAELEALQLRRLQAQLQRVYAAGGFFRRRFDDAGFDPASVTSLADFAKSCPTTEKADLIADQEAHPPFGSRVTVDDSRVARLETTSGSSGMGQEVYALTWADMETVGLMGAWTFAMQGVEAGDRLAVTLPLGFLQGPWGGDFAARALGSPILHLGLAPTAAAKLQYMQRFGINALFTPTPTFLMRLTVTAKELGIDPRRDMPQLKTAWLAGEAYPTEWVERMIDFWDIRLCESYGSSQGAFAATCEYGVVRDGARGTLHNMDWNVLMEVLEPGTDTPTEPGEEGEAVLTMLVREASPVIRFRTGDRVRLLPHDACPCGRQTVAIEAGTIARLDDMIKVKGMNIWPATVESAVFVGDQVHEYVGELGVDASGKEYARLNVALKGELPAEHRAEVLSDIRQRVHAATNVTMDVVEVPFEDLPTFEYKAVRWQDHRHRDLQSAS